LYSFAGCSAWSIAGGIEEAGGSTVSSNALWEHLKTKLLNANYTVYIRNAPNDAADAIRAFTGFVEQ